jgi:hypothetical protein
MVHWAVFERSGDRYFVRFEPERKIAVREPMTHNLVAWTPFLHCSSSRNVSGDGDFQRRLAVGWMNGER